MSQHPSLRSSDKDKQHRSVLKSYYRVKMNICKEIGCTVNYVEDLENMPSLFKAGICSALLAT